MSTRYLHLLPVFFCVLSRVAHAGESTANLDDILTPEVVVTADRAKTPVTQTASSVTVINEEQIRRSGKQNVADILRDVPGVSLVSSGGTGQLTYSYMRGMEEEHTLVLIDGVRVNDPADISRSFDFSNLSLLDVTRIEVVKGPQSVIHGSDAIGGVIQIFTKPRSTHGNPARLRYGASYGRYGTASTSLNLTGEKNSLSYSLGLEQLTSVGFSAAKVGSAGEPDGRRLNTINGSIRGAVDDQWSYSLVTRASYAKVDFDADAFTDSPDNRTRSRTLLARAEGSYSQSKDFEFKLGHGVNVSARNSDISSNLGPFTYGYFGVRHQTDAQTTWNLDQSTRLTVLLDSVIENADLAYTTATPNLARQSIASLAIEAHRQGSRLWGSLGARLDRHSQFGQFGTFRIAPGATLTDELRIKGALGTGFKAPSLYQLFTGDTDFASVPYGNPALKPERSVGAEMGLEWRPTAKNAVFALTLFENRVRDQIDGTLAPYKNLSSTLVQGAEWSAKKDWGNFDLRVAATRLFVARNELTRADLAQRPKLAIAWNPGWDVTPKLRLDGQFRFHGKRMNGSPSVELPSYTLVEVGGRWQWSPGLTLTGRIENALDRKYEEVLGYATAGRSITLGIEGTL